MMKKVEIVFCVLTYANTEDIIAFIKSVKSNCNTYRIIIVNSHYSCNTDAQIKEIAKKNDCDYIQVSNKGYGYGNNVGICYALEHYQFEYLVVSNPDIKIQIMGDLHRYDNSECIIAPKIVRKNGRNQNPMRITKPLIANYFAYIGFKTEINLLVYLSIVQNKINCICNRKRLQETNKIYQCHGSFLIFSLLAIKKLNPIYDENIFLFCEESDLADRCYLSKIPIFYDSNIIVFHKEDGSMGFSSNRQQDMMKKSYIYYFEKWFKKK